jgi:ABC-type antimicrobial peptide transport system permease subunit
MFKNYLKVALRNIARQKGYAAINIAGLAVGIAGCLLIMLWTMEEGNYDRFHDKADNVHMVLTQGTSVRDNPSTPFPLAEALESEIPEIEFAARWERFGDAVVGYGDQRYHERGVVTVDPSLFGVLTFEFLEGDPETALDLPGSVVIKEHLAKKYFGTGSAVGQVLTWNNEQEFTVTGVVAEPSGNTVFRFNILLPFEERLKQARTTSFEPSWGWFSPRTLVRLRDGTTMEEVNGKIAGFISTQTDIEDAGLSLLPVAEIRNFFSDSKTFVYIFLAVALFILVIACINYVNLSTARSADRAMDIGMRKVAGAGRGTLITQLLSESVITALFALVLALSLVEIFRPVINERAGLEISLDSVNPALAVPSLLALALLVGIAAGAYPAFYLSRFEPVKVIAGRLKSGASHSTLRRTLVIVQLAIAFALMVGAQVVYRQLGYVSETSVGYDKENLINVPLHRAQKSYYQSLKTELLRNEDVTDVTATTAGMPYFQMSTTAAEWEGKDPTDIVLVHVNIVDYRFTETFGIDVIEGRTFSEEFGSDATSGFVVNEKMAAVIGGSSALGANMKIWERSGPVVGVVKDFHFRPFNSRIEPMALFVETDPDKFYEMSVRLNPAATDEAIDHIRAIWESVLPSRPFEYSFVEEELTRAYRQTERMGRLTATFSTLAILLAGLGMVGLASFTAERRRKEIAIRKVFGGSVPDLVFLLSREYIICLIVAFVVASPPAYYFMNRWLQEFAYRIDIGLGSFAAAAVLLAGATLAAVIIQTVNAARRNPAAYL